MKRKNLNQKEYGYTHTKQRLGERYNLDITLSEYDLLCDVIRSIKDMEITINEEKDGLQFVVTIMFKKQPVTVVWEDRRDCITTVLPRPGE
jgi:hypothetical protein